MGLDAAAGVYAFSLKLLASQLTPQPPSWSLEHPPSTTATASSFSSSFAAVPLLLLHHLLLYGCTENCFTVPRSVCHSALLRHGAQERVPSSATSAFLTDTTVVRGPLRVEG